MIGANRIKAVKALQNKKNRQERGLFVVEGAKTVREVLHSDWSVVEVFATKAYLSSLPVALLGRTTYSVCSAGDLERMGSFQSNDAALAVVEMRQLGEPPTLLQGLVLALDSLNDPGNLGTIIRLADWYACTAVVSSDETTELYNHKTLSASKGSFLRIPVYHTNLAAWLAQVSAPVYAAVLEGSSVHSMALSLPSVLLLGSEAHGIHPKLLSLIHHPISIPRYGHAESLNVASAAAILLDHFSRQPAKTINLSI